MGGRSNCVIPLLHTGRVWLLVAVLRDSLLGCPTRQLLCGWAVWLDCNKGSLLLGKNRVTWHHQLPPRVTPTLVTPLPDAINLSSAACVADLPTPLVERYSPHSVCCKARCRVEILQQIPRSMSNFTEIYHILLPSYINSWSSLCLFSVFTRTHTHTETHWQKTFPLSDALSRRRLKQLC